MTASAAPGASRTAASSSGARSSVFDGMQAQNVHSPPTSARSTSDDLDVLVEPAKRGDEGLAARATPEADDARHSCSAKNESESAKPPVGVLPPVAEVEAGVVELGRELVAPELVRDLRAHLLAGGERHLEVELARRAPLVDVRAQEHLHPLVLRVPTRDVREAIGVEGAAELAVDDERARSG